jgi:glycosyltransferase involved in cell wall biosynthesis
VPNKRQDDLIRAFQAYHRLVNPYSRLLLVGSDANAPGYRLQLKAMAAALDLDEHVVMPGPVGPREGLGGYYRAADLFLCLSEHEGFCIPLLEAMAFDIPVLAYSATGVPYAMGGAGVLVSKKQYDILAELIACLVSDYAVRQRLIAGQRRRLERMSPAAVDTRLQAIVEQALELEGARWHLPGIPSHTAKTEEGRNDELSAGPGVPNQADRLPLDIPGRRMGRAGNGWNGRGRPIRRYRDNN